LNTRQIPKILWEILQSITVLFDCLGFLAAGLQPAVALRTPFHLSMGLLPSFVSFYLNKSVHQQIVFLALLSNFPALLSTSQQHS